MIDALFGSKTRVKLLYLFMNNPGKAFYVREITRLIDEQINSVRRELANMLAVGTITSNSTDNKLYYEVNQRYEFYTAFREIFAGIGNKSKKAAKQEKLEDLTGEWRDNLKKLSGLRVAIASGALVEGSASKVDLLLAGSLTKTKLASVIAQAESALGREISFSVMTYDEFYYRLSVRDRFIADVLANKHVIIVDSDNIVG